MSNAIVGEENTRMFRLITLHKALKLEVETGMPMSRISAYKIIKREFGLTGSKKKVLEQFKNLLNQKGFDL